MTFQFTLLSDTCYSPLSLSVAAGKCTIRGGGGGGGIINYIITGTDTDIEPDDAKEALLAYQNQNLTGSVLAVEVRDGKHGATHIWSMNKLKYRERERHHNNNLSVFRQRLMSMRELYAQDDNDEISSSLNLILQLGGDPFYDHTSWFKSIGHSYVFLSNLLVPVSLVRKVSIVGDNGEVKGQLTVSIRYMAGVLIINYN